MAFALVIIVALEVLPIPARPLGRGHGSLADLVTAAIALPLGVLVALGIRRRQPRSPASKAGCCGQCGFDMRATPYRCPECGDVWTMRRRH